MLRILYEFFHIYNEINQFMAVFEHQIQIIERESTSVVEIQLQKKRIKTCVD